MTTVATFNKTLLDFIVENADTTFVVEDTHIVDDHAQGIDK